MRAFQVEQGIVAPLDRAPALQRLSVL